MAPVSLPRTLLGKIWDAHEILRHPSGPSLLYIDRDMIAAEMEELFDEDRVSHQHGSSEPEAD